MSVTRVLFVCTGNICRSPLAEGVLLHLARERGIADSVHAESAGTGRWHVGDLPDPRARAVAQKHGIELVSRARQLDPARDYAPVDTTNDIGFDWLIALDLDHQRHMLRQGAPHDRVRLLRSFDPLVHTQPDHELEVPDPYYGPDSGFDACYDMVLAGCEGLLDSSVQRPKNY